MQVKFLSFFFNSTNIIVESHKKNFSDCHA